MTSSVSLAAAFVAGLVSFISPCVLPIVPGYLSFISGVNVAQFKEGGAPRDLVRRVVLTSLVFVLGFSTVFVALGAAATYVGSLLQEHKRTLGMVGGVIIIILGLHTAGLFKIKWLLSEKRANVQSAPARSARGLRGGPRLRLRLDPVHRPHPRGHPALRLPAGDGDPGGGAPLRLLGRARHPLHPLRPGRQLVLQGLRALRGSTCGRSRSSPGSCWSASGLLLVTNRLTLIAQWFTKMFPGLATIG